MPLHGFCCVRVPTLNARSDDVTPSLIQKYSLDQFTLSVILVIQSLSQPIGPMINIKSDQDR